MAGIKDYWKEIAPKAGLTAEQIQQVEGLLADPAVGKVFEEKFKTLSDYSRDLDATRDRVAKETEQKFKDWYDKEVAKPWNSMKTKAELVEKYQKLYGDLDDDGGGNGNTPTGKSGLSKEEVAELLKTELETRFTQRDSAVLDLLEVREQHMTTFKKGLNVKEFESAWKEHPEWGNSMKMAYEKFVEPQVTELKKKETDEYINTEVEKRVADLASRRGLPLDNGHKEFSPLFDRKADIGKLGEQEQEHHSREQFVKGFAEALSGNGNG